MSENKNSEQMPAVVVMAYRRKDSLQRLLDSLEAAVYTGKPKLVISVEAQPSGKVKKYLESFKSNKLDVQIIWHKENLGLRRHVIFCGDFSYRYKSIILLEDDLIVDRYFYKYTQEVIKFYGDEKSIGGFALYSPEFNEYSGFQFRPMRNGYDTYFMEVACSWGQCWTESQWNEFKKWYVNQVEKGILDNNYLPSAVKNWPESSWKKYYSSYMVLKKKFFVYPYQSYSTNCADSGGTHVLRKLTIHQVCLADPKREYCANNFCPLGNKRIYYDAYFEPKGTFIEDCLGISHEEVEIDFQGLKTIDSLRKKKYALTARKSKNSISTYEYDYRPIEYNLLYPAGGKNGLVSLTLSIDVQNNTNISARASRFGYFSGVNLGDAEKILYSIFMFFNRVGKRMGFLKA